MAAIRVLVLAADPLARAGLATLLTDEPGLDVVGRSDGADLHGLAETYRPAVVVWDAGWQPASVAERLTELTDEGIPLLLLLNEEGEAKDAWAAGVRGLLQRDVPGELLAAAVTALAAGLAVLDPRLVPAVHLGRSKELPAPQSPAQLIEPLTPRELQVLRLMADGLPNKTIAARLSISEHTVKFHVNALLGKLGAASRTEAVVSATRLGLILL